MIENNQKIIVKNWYDNKQVTFNKQVQKFSIILSADQSNCNVIQLPKGVQIETKYIELIKEFVEVHEYNLDQIKTKKIGLQNQKPFQNDKTNSFVEKNLTQSTDQQIRKLLSVCNFFKIQIFINVINLFLAQRYHLPFADQETKKKLQEYEVGNFTKKQVQDIKQRHFYYFKSFGQLLLMKLDQANQTRNQDTNPFNK